MRKVKKLRWKTADAIELNCKMRCVVANDANDAFNQMLINTRDIIARHSKYAVETASTSVSAVNSNVLF